jgi:hypothetical protein
MSVTSRVILAGMICAAMGAQAFAAPAGDDPGTTRGRLFHAGKCVMTLGFSGGCDKDEADANRRAEERKTAAEHPEVTKVADTTSTRHQFMRASKCVVSLGFVGNCDKNAPEVPASERRAEAAAAAPDTSTAGQFKRASKCVLSLGFVGDCDKK